MRVWTATWLALCLGSAPGCGDATTPAVPADEASFPVTVVAVERGAVQELLETFGTLELDPEYMQTLTAPRSGEVGAVHAVPGQSAQKGEALLELQPVPASSLQAERARIELDFAKRDVERVRRMAKLKLATNQEVQAAEKQLEASRIALASLGFGKKGALSVAAPADGVIAEILVAQGALVQPGQELIRLGSVGSAAVRVGFEVEEIPQLSADLPVLLEAVFQGSSDSAVSAHLSRLHRVADPATQLVEGLIQIDNPPEWAVAGTRVRVQVVLKNAPDALRIPRSALISRGDEHAVFLVEQDKAQLRSVQIGILGRDWVEIRSGLDAGQQVVLAGRSSLNDGATVRVVP